MRSERPKNLETKRVAFPWACGSWIHSKQGLMMQSSVQPRLSTLQPLQLMLMLLELEMEFAFLSLLFVFVNSKEKKEEREG